MSDSHDARESEPMKHLTLTVAICFLILIFAADTGAAGEFNEPPPRDLGQLKQAHLWATQYYHRRTRLHDAPYGLGAFGYRLVPFRTIAADRRVFTPGTVFFIPGLVGMSFEADGERTIHDGYVFFGDVGGAVRGHHIDMFTGAMRKNPAPEIITSTRRKRFEAYIVTDQALIERLRRLHIRPGSAT